MQGEFGMVAKLRCQNHYQKINNMIKWNLDPTLYNKEQLEALLYVVEQMDCSISKQLEEYIVETFEK